MVEFHLSLSDHPWGRVIEWVVDFEEEVRYLMFAWNGPEMVWVKASQNDGDADVNICYHPTCEDQVQLLAEIAGSESADLMLISSQVPTTEIKCFAELAVPSVLYRTPNHGLGLLAVPRAQTQSRRKKLWHIKPDAITPELAPFENAYGRYGSLLGHPFS